MTLFLYWKPYFVIDWTEILVDFSKDTFYQLKYYQSIVCIDFGLIFKDFREQIAGLETAFLLEPNFGLLYLKFYLEKARRKLIKLLISLVYVRLQSSNPIIELTAIAIFSKSTGIINQN